MTFARANPIGWSQYELFTAAQANAIDINVSRALDGYAGGTYTPSSTLEVDGAGVASGPAIKVRAAASGAAIHVLPNFAQVGLLVVGASGAASATTPADAVSILGMANRVGGGGRALVAYAGAGGSGGHAGNALVGVGGNATASGYAGGFGVYGFGGTPSDQTSVLASMLAQYSGAGVAGQGGQATNGSRRGGPGGYFAGGQGASGGYGGFGLVAIGGNYGTTPKGGAGGLFLGYGATGFGYADVVGGVGVIGIGGANSAAAYGVIGLGGSGSVGGIGVYGEGRGAGYGGHFVPGAGVVTALRADGAIDFSVASSAQRNPVVTEAKTNQLFAKNTIKAWGIVRAGALIDGFNIASVAINGTDSGYLDVVLAAAMASTDYAIICCATAGQAGNNPRMYVVNEPTETSGAADARTTTTFQIKQYDMNATPPVTINWATSECYFLVLGEQ